MNYTNIEILNQELVDINIAQIQMMFGSTKLFPNDQNVCSACKYICTHDGRDTYLCGDTLLVVNSNEASEYHTHNIATYFNNPKDHPYSGLLRMLLLGIKVNVQINC